MGGRRLVVVSERDHTYFDVTAGGALTIGRAPENEIVVKDDMVSRRHCQLEADDEGGLRLRDLKSFNGTYLNERRVRDGVMRLWDSLRVGRTKLFLVERAETEAGEGLVPALPEAEAGGPPPGEVGEAAEAAEADMQATRTLDVGDVLASKEIRTLVDSVVSREREEIERQTCRRVRDESGPSVLAALAGFKVRVRRIGPADGGGDFYDVFRVPLEPDELSLTLGSVSGVGIAACVAATSARHTLRGIAAGGGSPAPRELVDRLREVLGETLHPGSAVSLLVARLSAAGKVNLGALGGTGALLYKSATDAVEVLRPPGRRDEEALRSQEVELALRDGDRLLLVSDGAGSLRSAEGEAFGLARLIERLGAHGKASPKELVKLLSEDYAAFAGPGFERDVTLLALGQADVKVDG